MNKKHLFLLIILIFLLSSCSDRETSFTQQVDEMYSDIIMKTEKESTRLYSLSLTYPCTEYEDINKYISDYISGIKDDFIQDSGRTDRFSELLVDYTITCKTDSYLSLHLTATEPSADKAENVYMCFDLQEQKRLSLGDLVRETTMQKLDGTIKKILNEKNVEQSVQELLIAEIEAPENQSFLLSKDSMSFHPSRHHTDTDREPADAVSVPYEELRGVLPDSFLTAMGIMLYPTIEYQQNGTDGENNQQDTDGLYVALTFDDGPHPENTPDILETLAKYDAKATFYVIGQRVELYPEVVKAAYDAGHEIGVHTWSHPLLTKLTAAEISNEINQTIDAIVSITGDSPKTLRPPYGAYNQLLKDCITLPIINWSVDTLDWKTKNPYSITEIVKANTQNGSIILMHDIHKTSAEAVETVVRELTEKGYRFVTVSELLAISDPSEHAGIVYTHKKSPT